METTLEKKIFAYENLHFLPDGRYEIIDGEKIDMTPTGFRHGEFEGIFFEFIRKHLGEKGYVAVGEIGIVINREPLKLRAADVVYIKKDTAREKPDGILEFAPDLVIEILSKNDTAWGMNDKVRDYLSISVKRIILVDPFTESITIYQHGKKDAGNYNFDEDIELIEGVNIKLRDIL